MSLPYDATVKALLETDPAGWVRLVGHTARRVSLIDADVSTVTAAADKVIRVEGQEPWLLHVDLQAGPDHGLPRRGGLYNVLLDYRHDLPVHTVFVLLHPKANLSNLNGVYERQFPNRAPHFRFEYEVVRIWELEPSTLLKGIGTLPLAPLSAVPRDEIPDLIREMDSTLRKKCDKAQRCELWAGTYVLMGLRFENAIINQLLQGVQEMEESVTYQAIIAKGRELGLEQGRELGLEQGRELGREVQAQEILLLQGTKKFGKPSRTVKTAIEAIHDVARLNTLALKIFDVSSWKELLEE